MKYAFTLLFLAIPLYALSQNGAGKCPEGWEKHPEKFPACNIVLPVTLTSFTAKAEGYKVVLKWVTALEVNHSHYEVQRSEDGKTWDTVGTTKGYQFTDYRPANYYRLVSVDLDQTRHTYKMVYVALAPRSYTISTMQGVRLGTFHNLANAPKNTVLIINQTKTIIRQ